ncbi:MAG TPA: hypothetical protein VFF76_09680 [Holophagaceae bacterium]|nr:hypothetical protein [Holophagaceae bacterium]
MADDKELPKGYTCACGLYHAFSAYVFAHWNDQLKHDCPCGMTWTLVQGIPVPF